MVDANSNLALETLKYIQIWHCSLRKYQLFAEMCWLFLIEFQFVLEYYVKNRYSACEYLLLFYV